MKSLAEAFVILVYAGIIFTLVRPGSQGPKLVSSTTDGLANLLKASMGAGQSWNV